MERMTARARLGVALVGSLIAATASVVIAVTPAAALWAPPAGAAPTAPTYLYVESDAADSVGQGSTVGLTRATTDISVVATGATVSLTVAGTGGWSGTFGLPAPATAVSPGYYPNASVSGAGGTPTLLVSQGTRTCATTTGWIQVDAATYVAGALTDLALRFEQHCNGAVAALHGELHFDASEATPPSANPVGLVPSNFWEPQPDDVDQYAQPGNNYVMLYNWDQAFTSGGAYNFGYLGYGIDFATSPTSFSWTGHNLTNDPKELTQNFVAPSRLDHFVAGLYDALPAPGVNPVQGGFGMSGNIDCPDSKAQAAVDDVAYDKGQLVFMFMRFTAHCTSGSGEVEASERWAPPPAANTPNGVIYLSGQAGPGRVTLTWSAPVPNATPPVTGYQVTAFRAGTSLAPIVFNSTATTQVITGLDNDVPYTFQVQARNANGLGQRGLISDAVTPVLPHPTLAAMTPNAGPRRGGTTVTIAGNDLLTATGVTFDGVPATGVHVVSNTQVTANTPALALGPHHVVVVTPYGNSPPSAGDTFTAVPNPPAAPTGVGAAVNGAVVHASWSPPADHGDAPITDSVVVATSADGSLAPQIFHTNGGSAGLDLTGLLLGADYRFTAAAVTSAGAGPASAPSPVVHVPIVGIGPFTTAAAFAKRQYLDFVGRGATAREVNDAATALSTGTAGNDWINALRQRPEWGGLLAPLVRLYTAYFLRSPDTGGLTYWTGRLANSAPLAAVSTSFAGSAEFKSRYGSLSNSGFVSLVYQNVLGRAADSAGLSYWTGRLNSGTSRGTAMIGFSESAEYKTKKQSTVDVVLTVDGLLRRAPSSAELSADLAYLGGGGTVSGLIGQILSSAEYGSRSLTATLVPAAPPMPSTAPIAQTTPAGGAGQMSVVAGRPVPLRGYATLGPTRTTSLVRARPTRRLLSAPATIRVTYHGVPAQAEAAYSFAANLWAHLVHSAAPITVDVSWGSDASGLLGSAGAGKLIANFPNAPNPGLYYPKALANSFAGYDLDPSVADVVATLNSSVGWYFGIDGNPSFAQWDLVSVALHQIGQGLGFDGGFNVDTGRGLKGPDGASLSIFDSFVATPAGTPLSQYPNNSTTLGTALQSPAGFAGASTKAHNGGKAAALYMPNPWADGLSVYSLDEYTYPSGDPNSLMTPMFRSGEAIYDPGDVTLAMFHDMGWNTAGAATASLAPSIWWTSAGDHAADLAWTSPTDTGRSRITKYRISWFAGSSSTAGGTVDVDGGSNSGRVTGLTNGTSYRFKVVAINAIGSSPASAYSAAVTPLALGPFGDVDQFVRQQYFDILGRAPTGAETSNWVSKLNTGGASAVGLVTLLLGDGSVTKAVAPVVRLYSSYFNRLPDQSGLTYWAGRIRSGTALSVASDSFAGSTEFKTTYGSLNNSAFISLVYANVLGRAPDSAGYFYWLQQLGAGASRGSMMVGFSESSEHAASMANTVVAVSVWHALMQAIPDAATLTDLVAQLDTGTSESTIVTTILNSSAYAVRVA